MSLALLTLDPWPSPEGFYCYWRLTTMKFKFLKEGIKKPIATYGKKIKTGSEVELSGLLAKKALLNPDFELIEEAGPNGDETGNNQ
jgi:hypothetical protein